MGLADRNASGSHILLNARAAFLCPSKNKMTRFKIVAHVAGSTVPRIRSALNEYFEEKEICPVALTITRLGGTGAIQVAGIFTASVRPASIRTLLNKCGDVSYFSTFSGKSAERLGSKVVKGSNKRCRTKRKTESKRKIKTKKSKQAKRK